MSDIKLYIVLDDGSRQAARMSNIQLDIFARWWLVASSRMSDIKLDMFLDGCLVIHLVMY